MSSRLLPEMGLTGGPSSRSRLRCGCLETGMLLYRNIQECQRCGASWLLFAERWIVFTATAPGGDVVARAMAILPDSEPTQPARRRRR